VSRTAPCLIALFFAFNACSSNGGEGAKQRLRLIDSYPLALPEPSGLCMALDGRSLWTVSDETGRIYRIDLKGRTLETLPWKGRDLEGVARSREDGDGLWVVEERALALVRLDLSGIPMEQHTIELGRGGNAGLEGVCVAPDTGALWVLKEKSPALIVRLDEQFRIAESWTPIPRADCSGLAPAAEAGRFWIVSDEARRLFQWSPEEGILLEFPLDIEKAEGVAQGPDGRLYVVSDASARLYVFELTGR